jgi:hypothetical protein
MLARLEFHHTPKHGSWLNQAEIEISIVERGCLSRPVGDVPTIERRVRALEDERNVRHATIDWQFTNRQARVKLKKLYPVVTAQLDPTGLSTSGSVALRIAMSRAVEGTGDASS